FFQAEDGIRDRNVTGVQTCALPILNQPPITDQPFIVNQLPITDQPSIVNQPPITAQSSIVNQPPIVNQSPINQEEEIKSIEDNRSEERRVGKECRSWMYRIH